MSRLSRRNRTSQEIDFLYEGNLADLMDNAVKLTWMINTEEYDYIVEQATQEELSLLVLREDDPFHVRRKAMMMVERYLAQFAQS